MVVEAIGPAQVRRQGQHDEGRDRPDHEDPDRGQEGRPVPRLLEGLQRERQPDGLGRDGDPVDVVAGRHGGALEGHPLHLPAAQGRLSRLGVGLLRVRRRVTGKKARLRLRVRQLVPRPAGPAPTSTARATTRPCWPPPRPTWSRTSGRYWMEGKPAEKDIKAPDGTLLEKAGADARRRLLRRPHGRRRLLERRHGRERLHGPQVERVHRRLSRSACRPAQRPSRQRAPAGRRSASACRLRRLGRPMTAALARPRIAAPSPGCRRRRSRWSSRCSSSCRSRFVVMVSFWDYNDYEMLPGLHAAQLRRDLRGLLRPAARALHDPEDLPRRR